MNTAHTHYATVAQAIGWLRQRAGQQPSLDELAAAVGLSPAHLQRVFVAWAGVSPKRFVQYLNKEHALARLREGDTVLAASHAAGLSGPGRLHDLLLSWQAMTPGEVRSLGRDLVLHSGWGDTPFGPALLGWTARGVCHLVFETDTREAHEAELRHTGHWRSTSQTPRKPSAGWTTSSARRLSARRVGRCPCSCAAARFSCRCGRPCCACRQAMW